MKSSSAYKSRCVLLILNAEVLIRRQYNMALHLPGWLGDMARAFMTFIAESVMHKLPDL